MTVLPKWDLTDLYKNPKDPAIQVDMDTLTQKSKAFQKTYQGITYSQETLNTSIGSYEEIQSLATKLGVYARLLSFLHLNDGEIQRFFQQVVEFLTDIEQILTFFTLEINEIQEEPQGFYKPWLRVLRAMKPYQLDEKMEQLLSDKALTSTQMWMRLFDETLAKLRFGVDGEMGIAAVSNLLSHSDEAIRKQAATDISTTLAKDGDLFVTIMNTLAKDLEISDKWRGFEQIADSRHLSNDVEREVVDSLHATVKTNYKGLSHRFYKLKAKLMGVEKLSYWDRNAPLGDDTTTYSFDEAKEIVLKAYGDFNADVKAQVQKFFDNPWIDAAESPTKYSGAFNMPTFKGHHPYILLNFKGKLRDVTTLAHELGHGIHSLFADHQGTLMANAPLTLCETASVFGEMLTFQSLLQDATSKEAKIIALESKLSDMINTVVRQIAFYDFERKVHAHRRTKGELSREDINHYWLETQKEALGDGVEVPDLIQEFWMTIPHFIHSPFYVYAYAFGDCLVNSLYQVYKTSPEGFAIKYIDLLKAGGTKHHSELLAPFGLDASNPDFWQQGMDLIHDLLDQLESLS